MSNPMTFPPGVAASRPFTTPQEAVDWFNAANRGDVGDFPVEHPAYAPFPSPGGQHLDQPPWTLTPIYSAVMPSQMVTLQYAGFGEFPTGVPLLVVGNRRADVGIIGPTGGLPATDPDLVGVYEDAGYQTPAALNVLHRTLMGYESWARKDFDTADRKDRPAKAAYLGWFERALAATADQFVTACNRWVVTVWVDAVNDGLPVWPDPNHPTSPPPSLGGSFTLA